MNPMPIISMMTILTPNRKEQTMTKTVTDFQKMKDQGEKIVMVTAYDYAMGKAVAQSGVDLILIGDSVGMVVLGYETTLDVDVDQMIHHSIATPRCPGYLHRGGYAFMSYHNPEEAKVNAADLIVQGKANAVARRRLAFPHRSD